MKNERYYYSVLPLEKKKVYQSIYDGINHRAGKIYVGTSYSEQIIQEIYQMVLCDNPLFFFVDQQMLKMWRIAGHSVLFPEYLYSGEESRAIRKDIRETVVRVMNRADQYKGNVLRLEKYLHDSVVKSVAYDYDALDTDCCNAHSIVGAFLENKAVCEGISKAFKLLCNMYGIKCLVVLGKADVHGDFSGEEYHAWNMVKIGKESYHVDVTWDTTHDYLHGKRNIRYDYFNLTTQDIMQDHLIMGKLPICTATRFNYFYCTGSMVKDYDDLRELIEDRLLFHTISFKVHFSSKFSDMEEAKRVTAELIRSLSRERISRTFLMSVNERQRIITVRFVQRDL